LHHVDGRGQWGASADASGGDEQPVALFGIYAIADPALCADPEAFVDAVLRGGVHVVQYRAKSGVERDVVRRLRVRTSRANALLIVNDDVEAACDADGVHVGQEDLEAIGREAIRSATRGKVLGISCGVPEEALEAKRMGADYLGVGPFATTSTKHDAGPAIGPVGVAAVVRAVPGLPVAAIGGIGAGDVAAVAATGARMAVVLSTLARAPDPETAARELVRRWAEATS